MPVLAVVGRPNVGKSTLVNRIIGRREAVVEDVPGVTRDRVSYDANWDGRAFTVVDTGGWDPDARGLAERIAGPGRDRGRRSPTRCCSSSTRPSASPTPTRRSSRSCAAPASRWCWPPTRSTTSAPRPRPTALWNLGLGEPYPVSALHGRGSGDLLDAVLAALPEPPPERDGEVGGPRRIAIVGKPNVGKSSLLNKLAGEERVVVDNVAGTTVDPVDELVELGGRTWRFIDTAGHPQAGQGGVRARVLRVAAHVDRDRPRRGGRAGPRRRAVDLRAGRPDPADGPRGRPGAGDRVQQVGPGRRGAPLLPRARDRARPGAGAVGAADQRHRPHRLARRPAGAGAGQGARGLGDPDRHRRAQRVPRPAGRRAPAPGARRQAAEDPVRHPAVDGAADVRPVHQRQAGRGVRAVHRAPAARGVRLRRHPDRAAAAAAGEAQAADRRVGYRRPMRSYVVAAIVPRCSWPSPPPSPSARRLVTVGARPGGQAGRRHDVLGVPGRQLVARGRQSTCRVHRRSRAVAVAHVDRASTCTPTSARRTATDPNYGIPITVVEAEPPQGPGAVRLRRARATGCATRSAATPGSRAAAAPTATGTRSSSTRAACKLYETCDTRVRDGRWRAGSGAVWSLRSNRLRPDGWTSADAAGLPILPGLLRWNEVRADRVDHAIRFTTDVTSRAPPLAGPARRRLDATASPTRRWAPGSGCKAATRRAARRRRPRGGPGDEDVRPGARRQRVAVVLPGRAATRSWPDRLIEDLKRIPASRVRRRRHLLAEGLERQRPGALMAVAQRALIAALSAHDPIPGGVRRCGSVHAPSALTGGHSGCGAAW